MGQVFYGTDLWPMWPSHICWPIWPMTHRPIVCSAFNNIVNLSHTSGQFHHIFQESVISHFSRNTQETHCWQRPTLRIPSNLQPLSHTVSKIIERVHPVATPVKVLHNPHQFAYCKHHSTETALLYIHDHLMPLELDHISFHVFALLPLSTPLTITFQTMVKGRLLNRPFTMVWNSICCVLGWFKSQAFRLIHDFSSERMSSFWCQSLHLYSLFYNCTLNILLIVFYFNQAQCQTLGRFQLISWWRKYNPEWLLRTRHDTRLNKVL